jgi:hypothetical protein
MDSTPFAMAVQKTDVSEGRAGWSDGQIVNASSGDGMNLSPTALKQAGVDLTTYSVRQGLAAATSFVAKITPLLGLPFDHRLTILCGEKHSDSAGCTPR